MAPSTEARARVASIDRTSFLLGAQPAPVLRVPRARRLDKRPRFREIRDERRDRSVEIALDEPLHRPLEELRRRFAGTIAVDAFGQRRPSGPCPGAAPSSSGPSSGRGRAACRTARPLRRPWQLPRSAMCRRSASSCSPIVRPWACSLTTRVVRNLALTTDVVNQPPRRRPSISFLRAARAGRVQSPRYGRRSSSRRRWR